MALFKCKMCGGELEITDGMTVCECQYCGTKQTLPRLDDEKKIKLYDRANHFRRNNEYDKAMGIYETILSEDNEDAEAYWSIVLCRYGIEYVEDPATKKRIPTVNRAQYTSVFIDENYQSAIKYADGYQRDVYEAEAKAIDDIQKGILEISSKEEPFDAFICYKETDHSGRRTQDSVYAQDIYKELTNEGYKVFFSRITLEDKLGTAYEPYIFAALNSAKVMIAVGTKNENFNSVWVKNEWNRYLALIKAGEDKTLIPVYKDMDPYDLPDEFSYLQAQDMNKVGFMQDLVRGVKKIISQDVIDTRQKVGTTSVIIDSLTNRASTALANEEWDTANRCYDSILDYDDKNVDAYVGKLMASNKVNIIEKLADLSTPLENDNNYKKAITYADEKTKEKLEEYNSKTLENANNIAKKQRKKKNKIITIILSIVMVAVLAIIGYYLVVDYFPKLQVYNSAIEMRDNKDFANAKNEFKELGTFKDSEYQVSYTYYLRAIECYENKDYSGCKASGNAIVASNATNDLLLDLANKLINVESYDYASVLAVKITDDEIKYNFAVDIYNAGEYDNALTVLEAVSEGYKERDKYFTECKNIAQEASTETTYKAGCNTLENGSYSSAISYFKKIKDYKESSEKLLEAEYQLCRSYINGEINSLSSDVLEDSLSDIVSNNYKDAKQLENKYNTPSADILFNTNEFDGISDNSSVPNYFIIHFNITDRLDSNGPYKVTVTDPNGETHSSTFENDSGYLTCQSPSGKLTVKVYDSSGNQIGSKSVTVL